MITFGSLWEPLPLIAIAVGLIYHSYGVLPGRPVDHAGRSRSPFFILRIHNTDDDQLEDRPGTDINVYM